MARVYKTFADYDNTQQHFAFDTAGSDVFLQVGAVQADDLSFLESLIGDGFVGFFQEDVEQGYATITGTFDAASGIPVNAVPEELVLEDAYTIRFTQARPGLSAVRDAQVQNVQIFDTMVNRPASILRQYQQGRPFGTQFGIKWYSTVDDFSMGIEIPQAMRPTNVQFQPATPVQAEGTHLVAVMFMPIVETTLYGEIYVE